MSVVRLRSDNPIFVPISMTSGICSSAYQSCQSCRSFRPTVQCLLSVRANNPLSLLCRLCPPPPWTDIGPPKWHSMGQERERQKKRVMKKINKGPSSPSRPLLFFIGFPAFVFRCVCLGPMSNVSFLTHFNSNINKSRREGTKSVRNILVGIFFFLGGLFLFFHIISRYDAPRHRRAPKHMEPKKIIDGLVHLRIRVVESERDRERVNGRQDASSRQHWHIKPPPPTVALVLFLPWSLLTFFLFFSPSCYKWLFFILRSGWIYRVPGSLDICEWRSHVARRLSLSLSPNHSSISVLFSLLKCLALEWKSNSTTANFRNTNTNTQAISPQLACCWMDEQKWITQC